MKQSPVHTPNIELIPIERIHVLNPRSRDPGQHSNITESIRLTGLRRPITVSRRLQADGTEGFDLVCGQGRMEALLMLGHSHVPAVVIEASEEDCLVRSLIENIARRAQRPIETMREIGRLRSRGHTDVEVGELIGATASWVSMVGGLLDRGEERLLVGVQTGVISLSMATDIARASSPEIQNILSDAYAQGIRGKRMGRLRRLLEVRANRSPRMHGTPPGVRAQQRKLSVAEMRRLLEKEADRQRLVVKKAEFVHERLAFCVTAMRELLKDRQFQAVLKSEKLDTMPKMLAERLRTAP